MRRSSTCRPFPPGYTVALADDKGTFAGSVPAGPVWQASAELVPHTDGRRVIVSMPLNDELLLRVAAQSPLPDGVDLALASGGHVIASPDGLSGDLSGFTPGQAASDGSIGDADVRAQVVRVGRAGEGADGDGRELPDRPHQTIASTRCG